MICFAFHDPFNLYHNIDATVFETTVVCDDRYLREIEKAILRPCSLQRVLIIRGVDRLHSYYDHFHLLQFKIILIDSPQQLFKHYLIFSDAIPKPNGIWTVQKFWPELLHGWLLKMNPGTGPDPIAKTWSYDEEQSVDGDDDWDDDEL